MALIHQDLYQNDNLKGVNVKSYLEDLCSELFNTYNIEEVQLINLLGQSVKVWNEIEPINQREIRIPVENISDGSYIINVKSNDGKSSNKKVIIRL